MLLTVERRDELDDFLVLASVLREELVRLQNSLRSSHFALERCGINERAGLEALRSGICIRLRVIGRLYEQAKNFERQVVSIAEMHKRLREKG